VLVALLVLWIVSAIRVAGAAARHEVFGAEATLAFLSLILVPCIVFRAHVRPTGASADASRSSGAPAGGASTAPRTRGWAGTTATGTTARVGAASLRLVDKGLVNRSNKRTPAAPWRPT
jgi:hypothetical protein